HRLGRPRAHRRPCRGPGHPLARLRRRLLRLPHRRLREAFPPPDRWPTMRSRVLLTVSRLGRLLVVLPLVLSSAPAWAVGEPPSASASAPAPPPSAPLPHPPTLQPDTFPEPDPAALKELDRLLERLVAEDERSRTDAHNAIAEVSPSIVPAIRHRVQDVRSSIDREEAARILEAARKAGRKARKAKDEGEG